MKDRSFKSFLGSAGAAWRLAPRARQPERMRRVGVLHFSEHDPELKSLYRGIPGPVGGAGLDGRQKFAGRLWVDRGP